MAPHQPGYHNLAATVGSGTFLYGAMAWRFHRDDFRMASLYGVPEGSSLVDWPIGHEDLAPWYDHVEKFAGVSGSKENLPQLPDSLFQPPMPMNIAEKWLKERLEAPFAGAVASDDQPHSS